MEKLTHKECAQLLRLVEARIDEIHEATKAANDLFEISKKLGMPSELLEPALKEGHRSAAASVKSYEDIRVKLNILANETLQDV